MIHELFSSPEGERIYKSASCAIKDHSMHTPITKGVLIGFSGGADSVALLLTLLHYREKQGNFPIMAVHVNHMIRGDEAERDEAFSKDFCEKLGVEFTAVKIDVPAYAQEHKLGTEEAARRVRYDAFFNIINSDKRFSTIAVAHNATDNLETIIFNMMRGSGLSGMCGIAPVRENIIRPLIYSPKDDIRIALQKANIPFMIDSTNDSTQYSRNYIRHTIIPLFKKLTPSPEAMGSRLSSNLLDDKYFLESSAQDFLANNSNNGRIAADALSSIHKALFARVLREMCRKKGDIAPERTHIDAIYSLLGQNDFSYSLPGNLRFVCSNGFCYITDEAPCIELNINQKLSLGINEIEGYSSVVIVSDEKNIKSYSNVYNLTIQAKLRFDIINGSLCVRSKKDGDSYACRGMTRKLKKLFNDKKIPISRRNDVPVICDNVGILWVAGFGARDVDTPEDKHVIVALAEPKEAFGAKKQFYIPRRIK